MPEGPSIVILKELAAPFKGKHVLAVSGNAKADKEQADGQTVRDFKSWGKHFLICFDGFTIKIHFLLFGSYRINEERDMAPRLSLKFKNGTMNFYACSVKVLEGDLNKIYDWTVDVMSDSWDANAARKKLQKSPKMLVCDALLDQNIFAGSGNIIKNEVLFRTRIHPKSTVGALSPGKLNELIKDVRNYSFDFLKWKKAFTLRKHWLVHTKKTCPRCKISLIKEYLGTHHRRTFYCQKCQKLYVSEPYRSAHGFFIPEAKTSIAENNLQEVYMRKKTTTSKKKWSKNVTEHSDAMTLEKNVFKGSATQIANSLKRSAERSHRRKSGPYQSAMSMLTFYTNRGGKNLSAAQRKKLNAAKDKLKTAFGKQPAKKKAA